MNPPIKILFCGDVMGRAGREAVQHYLPLMRNRLNLDLVVLNGENAAGGFGITEKICKEFFSWGVDVITSGNHVWDQKSIIDYFHKESLRNQEPRLIRPINYQKGAPGQGFTHVTLPSGGRALVMNAMARLFMEPFTDDPFTQVSDLLQDYPLGRDDRRIIILDFHGETTSEKTCMGYHVDGDVTLVVGTHTHVPTSDHRILPKGTAYMSDVGMCGDFDSSIGVKVELALAKFYQRQPSQRFEVATEEATFCAVYVEADPETGLARSIHPIQLGGVLKETQFSPDGPLAHLRNLL